MNDFLKTEDSAVIQFNRHLSIRQMVVAVISVDAYPFFGFLRSDLSS